MAKVIIDYSEYEWMKERIKILEGALVKEKELTKLKFISEELILINKEKETLIEEVNSLESTISYLRKEVNTWYVYHNTENLKIRDLIRKENMFNRASIIKDIKGILNI